MERKYNFLLYDHFQLKIKSFCRRGGCCAGDDDEFENDDEDEEVWINVHLTRILLGMSCLTLFWLEDD